MVGLIGFICLVVFIVDFAVDGSFVFDYFWMGCVIGVGYFVSFVLLLGFCVGLFVFGIGVGICFEICLIWLCSDVLF